MNKSRAEPLTSARFRVEIEGLQGTGCTEVVLPEARRLDAADGARDVHYGTLTLRRGVSGSGDWYEWWDEARSSDRSRRTVTVVVADSTGADAHRLVFADAQPVAYSLSPLNALGSAPFLETLELSVLGFSATFDTR